MLRSAMPEAQSLEPPPKQQSQQGNKVDNSNWDYIPADVTAYVSRGKVQATQQQVGVHVLTYRAYQTTSAQMHSKENSDGISRGQDGSELRSRRPSSISDRRRSASFALTRPSLEIMPVA